MDTSNRSGKFTEKERMTNNAWEHLSGSYRKSAILIFMSGIWPLSGFEPNQKPNPYLFRVDDFLAEVQKAEGEAVIATNEHPNLINRYLK